MPTLARTSRRRPASATGARRRLDQRAARRPRPPPGRRPARAGRRTRRRPGARPCRRGAGPRRCAPATRRSSSSPAAWPSESLTVLKSSRSTNSTAIAPPRPRGGQRAPHAVLEQRAVGQPGERVVERAAAQLLLERDPVGDVAGEQHERADLPVVQAVLGQRLERARLAVRPGDRGREGGLAARLGEHARRASRGPARRPRRRTGRRRRRRWRAGRGGTAGAPTSSASAPCRRRRRA